MDCANNSRRIASFNRWCIVVVGRSTFFFRSASFMWRSITAAMTKHARNCLVECFNIGDFCYYMSSMVEGPNLPAIKVLPALLDDYELFC